MSSGELVPNADSDRWISGKPFTVHAAMVDGFRHVKNLRALSCGFCMLPLVEGARARWVHIVDGRNTFVCHGCDSPDVAARWSERWRIEIAPILRRWCEQ